MPPGCLALKLRPVRRAHNLTLVLLPESIVEKRTEEMDPKLANSSYLGTASLGVGVHPYLGRVPKNYGQEASGRRRKEESEREVPTRIA